MSGLTHLSYGRPHPRRGAALLVVLAVLLLTLGAMTTTARLAASIKLQRRAATFDATATDLLHQAEQPLQAWLSNAGTVVLPPDVEHPEVPVLHHRWRTGETECALVVTAWDQCGMMPVGAPSSSPLRTTLPIEVSRILTQVTVPRRAVVGLDLYVSPANALERRRIYPEPQGHDAVVFLGDSSAAPEVVNQLNEPDEQEDTEPADQPMPLGAVVATHNAGRRINVNTAPRELLEAAFREARRGGVEEVMAAREAGTPSTLSGGAGAASGGRARRGGSSRRGGGRLIAASEAWAFRIDVQVGMVERSWWCVYRQDRAGQPWRCVQRLAITD